MIDTESFIWHVTTSIDVLDFRHVGLLNEISMVFVLLIHRVILEWESLLYNNLLRYSHLLDIELDDMHILNRSPLYLLWKVLFAGEACSLCYHQCLDGAFDTGTRAAECVYHEGLMRQSYAPGLDPIPRWEDHCRWLSNSSLLMIVFNSELVGYYLTDCSDMSDDEDDSENENNHNEKKQKRIEAIKKMSVQELVRHFLIHENKHRCVFRGDRVRWTM